MSVYRSVTLDARAATYIQNSVTAPAPLAQLLVAQLDLSQGQITTLLPASIPLGELYNFAAPIIPPHSGCFEQACRLIRTFLRDDPQRVFLVEYRRARRQDTWLAESDPDLPIVFVGDQVYFLLTYPHTDNLRAIALVVGRVVGSVPATLTLGVGAKLAGVPPALPRMADLDPALLAEIARNTRLLLTSAYHGEGFLLWKHI